MNNWTSDLDQVLSGSGSRKEFVGVISSWLWTFMADEPATFDEAISRRVAWKFPDGLVFSVGSNMHPSLYSLVDPAGPEGESFAPVGEDDVEFWAWSAVVGGWILKIERDIDLEASEILSVLDRLTEIHGVPSLVIAWKDSWAKRFSDDALEHYEDSSITAEQEAQYFPGLRAARKSSVLAMHKLAKFVVEEKLQEVSPWEIIFVEPEELISEWSDYGFFKKFVAAAKDRKIANFVFDYVDGVSGGSDSTQVMNREEEVLPLVPLSREKAGESFFGNGSICVEMDTTASEALEQKLLVLGEEFYLDLSDHYDSDNEEWEPTGQITIESDLWLSEGFEKEDVFSFDSEENSNSHQTSESDSLWESHQQGLVELNSNAWFEALGVVRIQERFADQIKQQEETHDYSWYFNGKNEASVVPGMEVDFQNLGEPQDLENSRLGKAVISELSNLGVSFSFGESEQSSQASKHELITYWTTQSGRPFIQHFQVFRNEQGEETGFWFVQLLASPVPLTSDRGGVSVEEGQIISVAIPEQDIERGLLSYGEVSSKIHIPVLLKKLAYMGETPFPSNQLFTLSRDLAFPNVPEVIRPTPSFAILRDSRFLSFSSDDNFSTDSLTSGIAAEMVVFGWRFPIAQDEHVPNFLQTMIEGCSSAVSTIEDGFTNFTREDSLLDYDSVLANPCIHLDGFMSEGSRLGGPRWIPVTMLGDKFNASKERFQRANDLLAARDPDYLGELFEIYDDGVGSEVIAKAINAIVHQSIIPELAPNPETLKACAQILQQAINLNVPAESTQALVYMGLARLLCGEIDGAREALEESTKRPDGKESPEAKHYLSLLFRKIGDSKLEAKWAAESKAAGGFLAAAFIAEDLGLSSQSNGSSTSPTGHFCPNCGSEFKDEDSRCKTCGANRLDTT
jgi:hypothetical protein